MAEAVFKTGLITESWNSCPDAGSKPSPAEPSLWPGWCRVHAYSPPVNSRQLQIFCVPVFGLVRFRFLIRDGVRDRLLGQLGHRGRRNFFGLVVGGSKPGWFFWFPGLCSRQCFALLLTSPMINYGGTNLTLQQHRTMFKTWNLHLLTLSKTY